MGDCVKKGSIRSQLDHLTLFLTQTRAEGCVWVNVRNRLLALVAATWQEEKSARLVGYDEWWVECCFENRTFRGHTFLIPRTQFAKEKKLNIKLRRSKQIEAWRTAACLSKACDVMSCGHSRVSVRRGAKNRNCVWNSNDNKFSSYCELSLVLFTGERGSLKVDDIELKYY